MLAAAADVSCARLGHAEGGARAHARRGRGMPSPAAGRRRGDEEAPRLLGRRSAARDGSPRRAIIVERSVERVVELVVVVVGPAADVVPVVVQEVVPPHVHERVREARPRRRSSRPAAPPPTTRPPGDESSRRRRYWAVAREHGCLPFSFSFSRAFSGDLAHPLDLSSPSRVPRRGGTRGSRASGPPAFATGRGFARASPLAPRSAEPRVPAVALATPPPPGRPIHRRCGPDRRPSPSPGRPFPEEAPDVPAPAETRSGSPLRSP